MLYGWSFVVMYFVFDWQGAIWSTLSPCTLINPLLLAYFLIGKVEKCWNLNWTAMRVQFFKRKYVGPLALVTKENKLLTQRPVEDFKDQLCTIFSCVSVIDILKFLSGLCQRISVMIMSALFQVMAWCRQAASYYLNQYWPNSMIPYGISSSLFYQHGLTLILAWISNYMPGKVWDESTYPFQTSTVAPLKFWNG